MYSRKTVERDLKVMAQNLGFDPVYHSVKACDEAVSHFDYRLEQHLDQHGEGKDELFLFDQDEIRWMRNERALCQLDYLYYATRYAFINVNNEIIHYVPQLSQQIINNVRSKLEDLGWAIILQVLKARQVGITTDSQIAISHRTWFYPNVIAVTGSCEEKKSGDMLEKYTLMYEQLPYWLRPNMTRSRTGSRFTFGDMNSQLIMQHGRQKTGIGRGNTPTVLHLSELSEFEDPEGLIDEGLMPAIHETPEILFVLESTANGPHNWWYKKWFYNKAHYWERRSRMCPLFLPWFTRPDIYPTPTWLHQHPVPIDWTPLSVTISHAERAKKNVYASDYLRAVFSENWQMPREQMWFWEVMREEYRAANKLDGFLREFCSDDLEAFQASGLSVFDVDTIQSYNESCEQPKAIFAFRAAEKIIPARYHPQSHEIDTTRKPIDMGRYELVPVKWKGWEDTAIDGKLILWEWPEEHEEYGMGIDTSDGIGKDRSVIEVMRKGSVTRNDCQVAELASPYINAEDLAPMAHAIGLLYQNGGQRQPRIAIECMRNGELTQFVLRNLGWSNFHPWFRYDRKKVDVSKGTKLGWMTNSWSRPMMMDKLIKALRDGSLDINSREFVREMQSLHRDWDAQDARAEHGAFDDRIMALGIIYFSLHILEFSGAARDVTYMRQSRDEKDAWKYRGPVYDDHEMRVEHTNGVPALSAPMLHPGGMDRSWEEYE